MSAKPWSDRGPCRMLSSSRTALQIQPYTRTSLMLNYDPLSHNSAIFGHVRPFSFANYKYTRNTHPFNTPLAHTITEN